MKTQTLLPLTATLLFAACTGAMLMSARNVNPAAPAVATPAAYRIVDLPAVVVHPDSALLAASATKIVDLPAVVVHADPQYRDAVLASREPQIVDLPALTVRPDVEDAPLLPITPVAAAALAR